MKICSFSIVGPSAAYGPICMIWADNLGTPDSLHLGKQGPAWTTAALPGLALVFLCIIFFFGN